MFIISRKAKPIINGNLEKLRELTKKLTELEREKDRIHEELQWREQAFNCLVQTMFDWVWITNEKGEYSYVSPKSNDIYGYINGDILGKMPHDFLQGQARENTIQMEQYLIQTHEPVINYEAESTLADGTKIQTITNAVPMFDSNRNYKGHLGVEKIVNEP